MKKVDPESLNNYYLEKVLSESAQLRAYNEHQQTQRLNRRVEELKQRQETRERLRSLQNAQSVNPVVYALATLFGAKKSA